MERGIKAENKNLRRRRELKEILRSLGMVTICNIQIRKSLEKRNEARGQRRKGKRREMKGYQECRTRHHRRWKVGEDQGPRNQPT